MLTIDEIRQKIDEDATSIKKRDAKVGVRYYEGKHDILNYRMFYFNEDGKLVEDTNRTNVRIPHPFFTELVDQCTQYILSGNKKIITSENEELQRELNKYFDEDFIAELSEAVDGIQQKGYDYMFAYTKENGRTGFQHADSLNVVEVRSKEIEDDCDYIIYYYSDRRNKDNKPITRIQVIDKNSTYYYVKDSAGKIEVDENEQINPKPHRLYTKGNDDSVYFEESNFLPFFRLDNNKKQTSIIKKIKTIIDDYDIMACGLSNNLADFDYPLHVVKGFNGTDLGELQKNLKTKKIISIPKTEGGVEVHTVDIPYEARLQKMEQDEKNIYRFGMGFNSAQLGDGNITNVVIKSRYALLDLKSNKLETKLRQFLKKLIVIVIDEINEINGTDYTTEDVEIRFEKEIITNANDNATIEKTKAETKQIELNTLLNVGNVIDSEAIIEKMCSLLDIDYEEFTKGTTEDDIDRLRKIIEETVADE